MQAMQPESWTSILQQPTMDIENILYQYAERQNHRIGIIPMIKTSSSKVGKGLHIYAFVWTDNKSQKHGHTSKGTGVGVTVYLNGKKTKEIRQSYPDRKHPKDKKRTELMVTDAILKAIPPKAMATIHTKSDTIVNGINGLKHWTANGWKTQTGTDVQNQDVWKRIHAVNSDSVEWVRVPDGKYPPGMSRACNLAREAIGIKLSQPRGRN
jgi:ribonuclease HI